MIKPFPALILLLATPALALFPAACAKKQEPRKLTHQPLAFPGAQGFGAAATGGRGGDVVHVTTLADAGPGSLRDALSKPNRTILFDVAGVITLQSPLSIPSNISLLGQSAPGDGIEIYNNACSISGQSNIIIRYLRFRAGMASARGAKTLGINYSHNIILDHLSISWGRWDNTGMTAKASKAPAGQAKALQQKAADDHSHDITMQDCLISEGIDPQRFGALLDEAENITIARTLWADNNSRNPKAKGTIQIINDVVYNWEAGGMVGGHSAAVWHQDYLNNILIAGPQSKATSAFSLYADTDNVFSSGNLVDFDKDGSFNPRPLAETDFRGNSATDRPTFVKQPFNHPATAVPVLSTDDALAHVLAHAGASLHRDAIDARIIAQVKSFGKEGAIIHDEKEVGGITPVAAPSTATPTPDADHDGIPDAWESAHGLDPKNPADAATLDKDGYSHLEAYLNALVAP